MRSLVVETITGVARDVRSHLDRAADQLRARERLLVSGNLDQRGVVIAAGR